MHQEATLGHNAVLLRFTPPGPQGMLTLQSQLELSMI